MLGIGVIVLVLSAPGATWAEGESSDQRFLAGLRQRRLFELAEGYCTARLSEPELAASRRAELVIEWSLTLAERAVNSAPDQREPLWTRALEVTEAFSQEAPESPQLPLVRFQGILSLLARGELARQESQVAVQKERLLAEARTSLRAATRRLEGLAQTVQRTSLGDNVRYQLARAHRNEAQCYQPLTPDWASSLTLALTELAPLAKLDTAHPLAWKSRLDEIVCHRLLADYPTAQRKLEALQAAAPPPAIALRARAEQLRLALAADRLTEAIQMVSGPREVEGVTSGELDYAFLETCLAAWRAAAESNREQEAVQWQTKANDMVAVIQRQDGPYWTRRAQMLLSGYIQALPGGNLDMQIQAAENAYHGGQYDDALAAYDRVEALAREQGENDRAFELGFVAATIEHRRERHREAMVRYHQLATKARSHPKAPEAHLLAIHHAGQLVLEEPTDSLQQYAALAEEHLALWPNASTTNQARHCLGFAHERRRDWRKGLEQYQAISPDYAKFDQVADAVARCSKAWIDQCKTTATSPDPVAAAAAGWFESLLFDTQGRGPEKWGSLHRRVALDAARFRLDSARPDFARAEQIVSAALDGSPDAPPDWQSTARGLLVFSLAGQGRRDEAARVLERISAGPPGDLLAMLEGLSRVATTAGPEVRRELAQLQLRALDLLRPRREQLSPSGQRTLDRTEAQALADAGRSDDALKAYQSLAQTHASDGEIQEGYARLLLNRSDPASLKAALAKWREVEKKSRPGTERWFRAKMAVALSHYRSDNEQQAEKILRLLMVLHPEPRLRDRQATAQLVELLDPAARDQLFALLDRCERKPP